MKDTWKIINEILKAKKTSKTYPSNFRIENKEVTDPKQISNSFAEYFSNLGSNLSKIYQTQTLMLVNI